MRPRFACPVPAIECRGSPFFPNACGSPYALGLSFERVLPFARGIDGLEEPRARVPAPRHKPPRRREMRFHRVIILKMPRLRVRQDKSA